MPLDGLRVLVAPIAFNEAGKIGVVLDRCLAVAGVDVAVVDDGSTDDTPAIVRAKGARCIRQEPRRGVGAAIRTALRIAATEHYDVLVVMAGNDKDRPDEIPRLIAPIAHDGAELVQGSRYLPGGAFGGMPAYRQWATRWLHPALMSWCTGQRLTDTTNGFRAIRLSLLADRRIHLDQPWLDHYELEPYLLFRAITLGHLVVEVPVSKLYPPKALGYTKMPPITGWWSILRPVILLGLRLKR